jgi:uncharacterized protein YaiI (UPF0178 family)
MRTLATSRNQCATSTLAVMTSSFRHPCGPAPYGQSDRQNFANQLDRHLARYGR